MSDRGSCPLDQLALATLVMGFGNVRERAIGPAIAAIADLLS
jgi:hypothetical protein